MADAKKADIVIFGAGIAGLWTFHRLKKRGYDVLLLEKDSIGCGQTIASQGIIHSGLKFVFAGKINKLAQSISAMPDVWREAMRSENEVDLTTAKMSAESQYLLIPKGLFGGLSKIVAKKALGKSVREVPKEDWPEDLKSAGFEGAVIFMGEPVLDIGTALRSLAEPYRDSIRKISKEEATSPFDFLKKHKIDARKIIFTSAASNQEIAEKSEHAKGLETQKRPLHMGFLKPAPFPLFAHLVGKTDKPVATITTHKTKEGELVWYLGGGVAERSKDSDPKDVFDATKKALKSYLPNIDLANVEWTSLPIDRVEGKSRTDSWIPDTPTIHHAGKTLYCWPTKLTFAPMLSDMLIKELEAEKIAPSGTKTNWTFLPPAEYTKTPWDSATWTKHS